MMSATIRKAEPRDLGAVNRLLGQVLKVHHAIRPDLFRPEGKKYTDAEILSLMADPETPIFVYEADGEVLGYAFCAFQRQDSGSLMPLATLYVDDICVEESARGRHVGKALFAYVRTFAAEQGCHNITLHVWEGNTAAAAFYAAMGMHPQYTSLEILCP